MYICKVIQKVLPVVKLKNAGKIKFEKLWNVIEDRVDDNRRGKVACIVFIPNKKNGQKLLEYQFLLIF